MEKLKKKSLLRDVRNRSNVGFIKLGQDVTQDMTQNVTLSPAGL